MSAIFTPTLFCPEETSLSLLYFLRPDIIFSALLICLVATSEQCNMANLSMG
jgi:hypothetical protein